MRFNYARMTAMNGLRFRIAELVERYMHRRPVLSEEHGRTMQDTEFLARVRAGVEQHYADPYFTTNLAALSLGMSRMHLNRRLRALTGKSTHEYILELRLETAREMLLRTSWLVSTIGSGVGFRSASHFAEAFRKRFGVSPSRFRNLYMKPESHVDASHP